MIAPYFKDRNIPICLSTDEKYVPYLCVAVKSVIDNADAELNYDIVVLHEGLSRYHIRSIESLSCSGNISIRTFDVKEYMTSELRKIFVTKAYYTLPTYFRFFIPDAFRGYDKVLYLDCDLVALRDVSALLEIDLEGFFLAAARDVAVVQQINSIDGWEKYFSEDLKIDRLENIFQAGVLVFNVRELKSRGLLNLCIAKLTELPNPRVLDQCILNSVCEHKVLFLGPEWNVMWNLPFLSKDLERELGSEVYRTYMESRENPCILHYSSSTKPWHEPNRDLAAYFWKYARRTPYYEYILFADLIQRKISLKERFFNIRLLHWIYRSLPNGFQEKLSRIKDSIMK